jgi:hypothetical protein
MPLVEQWQAGKGGVIDVHGDKIRFVGDKVFCNETEIIQNSMVALSNSYCGRLVKWRPGSMTFYLSLIDDDDSFDVCDVCYLSGEGWMLSV